jgi:Fur family peroxide stress response transcriptional regulator
MNETDGRRNVKHSAKRDAILKALRETTRHPGAQWIYNRLKPSIPGLSLATVYRNLNRFREEGAVLSLGVINGEERFDGFIEPHPHLACGRCGAVEDIPLADAAAFEKKLEAALGSFVNGGNIAFRSTLFYGLCTSCINSHVQ